MSVESKTRCTAPFGFATDGVQHEIQSTVNLLLAACRGLSKWEQEGETVAHHDVEVRCSLHQLEGVKVQYGTVRNST